jgi:uncharacterized protein
MPSQRQDTQRTQLALVFVGMCSGLPACSRPAPTAMKPSAAVCATAEIEDTKGTSCLGPGALPARADAKNILGESLAACPSKHVTGFNRNGYCNTGPLDHGVHVVCASVSEAFLTFSRERGNDLVTPRGEFPGLKPGDAWCLCAERWREAHQAGVGPKVYAEATDVRALDFIEKSALVSNATQLPTKAVVPPGGNVQ